jgi:hypothetical protein
MTKAVIAKSLALAVVAVALAGMGSESQASFDFELTSFDYAKEMWFWYPAVFSSVIENTGTEQDTVDIVLIKNLPGGGWFSDVCIGGICVPDPAWTVLDPGEIEDLDVEIYVGGTPNIGEVTMVITSRGNPANSVSETYTAFAGIPSILLVDDDNGANYETYMEAAVDSAGYKARVWDADSLGRPGAVQLNSYWAVLWTTADGDASYLTSGDEQDMMTYLDNGGNLFLSSMEFLTSRGTPTTFITDYLHIESWTDDVGASTAVGKAGDPISDGMNADLTGGPFSTAPIDDIDGDGVIEAEDLGHLLSAAGDTIGVRVDDDDPRVVFHSFPFECFPTADPDPDNQNTLMSRIIEWFEPPIAGIPGRQVEDDTVVLEQNSPNPFAGSTRISFAVSHPGQHAEIEIYNVNGQVVRTLVSGPAREKHNSIVWDGNDNAGGRVASGVYFYRLSTEGQSVIKKMVRVN